MTYSLTYLMSTGQGCRIAETAGDAVHDHAALLLAGAGGIVIRDGQAHVVKLASVVAVEKLRAIHHWRHGG